MNDTTETTVELVEVPANETTLVPHSDSEAAPAEATVFIAEDTEAQSVAYDA